MSALKTQLDSVITFLANKIGTMEAATQPVNKGGTGATTKNAAKTNLGISYGSAAPSGGDNGDIYFQYTA